MKMRSKKKRIVYGMIILLAFSIHENLITDVLAADMTDRTVQETTTEETTAVSETTTEETTTEETTAASETTTEETTTQHETTTSEKTTTKKETDTGEETTVATIVHADLAVADTVSKSTVISFSKKKKLKAHLYVYSQGKKKTKKVRILATIQKYKKGKWIKYRKICKVKKSFYCCISKDIRLKSKGKYRAVIKIIYYGKKKTKIGRYKRVSKKIII